MKKILLVSTIPLSLKVFSLDFMKYLRDQGYDVQAASSHGPETEYIKKEGFKFHEINISRNINPISDFIALKKLEDLLKKEKFDIIHTQTSKAGFIGRLAGFKQKAPLVVHTAHNWACHELLAGWKKSFYCALEKKATNWCDAIVVDTKAVRDYGLKLNIAEPLKIHQIYMGIDTNSFYPYSNDEKLNLKKKYGITDQNVVIGTIARLVKDKGIETLLACANKLRDNKKIIFMVVGGGELRPVFEKQVREYGIEGKVIFTGHKDDVVPYLNIFDIFCLPTLREGFGVVFAEAQSCGVPVVASDIRPLREVVKNGETGKLAPVNDVDGFVEALTELFDFNLREQYSKEARKHVEDNFDVNNINKQTLELYKQLWEKKYK